MNPQRRSNNKNKVSPSRKRSHSSGSSSSPESSNNLFSTASSSDSGSSSMTSVRSQPKKKRSIVVSDSSADSNTTTTASSSRSGSSSKPSGSSMPLKFTPQRSVPAFLNKLYNMVEDESTSDLIRWSKDGTSFLVEDHEEFAKTVLPRFYKHNTFASFVRQLNMYDFHKVPHLQQCVLIAENEHEIWEFSNPHFQRGRPDLLTLVTRKRNKDKDAADTENVSLSTLVSDLSLLKKHQSTIGSDLRDLHRDNEILWQETLNAREKYQRHQEAIEKIIQFLTTIFSNEHSAIDMSEPMTLQKELIDEAAILAGMGKGSDHSKLGMYYPFVSFQSKLSSLLANLYSTHHHRSSPPGHNMESAPIYNSFKSQGVASESEPMEDFSHTLNSASKSAQTISEDIDLLQVNIESLANNLGIDPAQFNGNLDAYTCRFQDDYSNMINSANSEDKAKLFALAENGNVDAKELIYSGDEESAIKVSSPLSMNHIPQQQERQQQETTPQGQFMFQSRQMQPSTLKNVKQMPIYDSDSGTNVVGNNGITNNGRQLQHRNSYPMPNVYPRPQQRDIRIPPPAAAAAAASENQYQEVMPMNIQEPFTPSFSGDGDVTYYPSRNLSFSYQMNQAPPPQTQTQSSQQELVLNMPPSVNYYSSDNEPKNIGMSTIPLGTRPGFNAMTDYDENYTFEEDACDVPS